MNKVKISQIAHIVKFSARTIIDINNIEFINLILLNFQYL